MRQNFKRGGRRGEACAPTIDSKGINYLYVQIYRKGHNTTFSLRNPSQKIIDMNSHETMQSTRELALLRAELERVHLHNIELSRQQFHFQQLFATGQFQHQAPPTASVVQFPNIATNYNPNYRNIFLSGALNADDWQKYIIDKLRPFPVCVFNPRREGDSQKHGGGEVGNQQAWEMEAIERCNCVVFWFPWDHPNITICLLQLGKELVNGPCRESRYLSEYTQK